MASTLTTFRRGALVAALVMFSVTTAHGSEADDGNPLHALLRLPLPNERGVRVHRFRLPLARASAELVDLHYELPLADALGDGDVVVNGGYWGWANEGKRRLIGLVTAAGRELSPLRAALDGGVFTLRAGKASVAPSRGYKPPDHADLAIQCKPRLVEARALVPSLNAHSRAARTAVCVRDGGDTLDLYLTEPDDLGPTLYDFGQWLVEQGCEDALNLDGGPSTAAGYREHGKLVRVGPGLALPYALRFKVAR